MFRKAESNVRSVVKTISCGSGVKPGSKPGAEPGIEYGKPRPAQSIQRKPENQRFKQKQGPRPAQRPERKSSWALIRSTRT